MEKVVIAQILEFDHGMNSESSDFNHVILGKIYNLSESQFTDILNTPNCMVGVGVNGGKWFWAGFQAYSRYSRNADFLSPPEMRL